MATRAPTLDSPAFTLAGAVRGLATRIVGAGLIGSGLFAALALVGFDARDPSWGHATAGPVANVAGPTGAVLADLSLQLLGLAAWLPALACTAWGVRLAFRRPLRWPWLPGLALPPAVMASAAALATVAPLPAKSVWPYAVGLGGYLGELLYGALAGRASAAGFATGALMLAVPFGAAALGLRWGESLAALAHAAGGARTAGRWLVRTVGPVTGAASHKLAAAARALRRRSPRPLLLPPPRQVPPAELAEDGRAGPAARARRARGPNAQGRPPGAAATAPAAAPGSQVEPEPASAPRRIRVAAVPDSRVDRPTDSPARHPAAEAAAPARRAAQAAAPASTATVGGAGSFELPDLELLTPPKRTVRTTVNEAALEETARQLEGVLDDFGVKGAIVDVKPGPVVTLYELEPAPGTRAQRVVGLADDIARSLCALSVRVATVPGRNVIGIELPNERRETVYLRDLFESDAYGRSEARLGVALGKDIAGKPIFVDLARMPHLLIAGTTGSGKSVAINAMILSLLYRLTPEQCRIIMIDPKVIELSVYEDIPHLLAPVVTEPHKAVVALKWVVRQMDERYRLMSHLGVRDIFAFNHRVEQAAARGEELKRRVRTGFDPATGVPVMEEQPIANRPLPLIVVVVDEVADLMLTAGKEIENAIQRLSQKARAAGIHLIVATQRPSVDVITGVIKANLPSRVSFRVSSKIDSRTILGDAGAEQLLGQGDMLYLMPGDRIVRVHGALVTDGEVEAVVTHLKAQGTPDYVDDVTSETGTDGGGGSEGDGAPALDASGEGAGADQIYQQAVRIVAQDGKASTSYLQRKLAIGYNSAAKLIERMERDGVITAADHVGRRRVLMGRGGVDGTEPTGLDG